MVLGGGNIDVGVWSRQALDRLIRDGVQPTPRNYALYYYCASSERPALTAAYDAIVARGKITQQECDALYVEHVLTVDDIASVQDASAVLDKELKKILEILSASSRDTGQFGENLDAFSGKLSGAVSVEVLREAVAKIADETQVIAAQNAKLQKDLAVTTVQLGEMRENFDRAHREALVDPLTEVGNRKFFDREILRTLAEAHQQEAPMSLVMVDIDHFKNFNDKHGHLIGDHVLRLVARTLVENLKGRDVIARYGGEEFVIILPLTRMQDAERLANQLRVSLASKRIAKRGTNEVLGTVTISLGVSEYRQGDDGDSMIARADAALYKAKQTGRNKVMCSEA